MLEARKRFKGMQQLRPWSSRGGTCMTVRRGDGGKVRPLEKSRLSAFRASAQSTHPQFLGHHHRRVIRAPGTSGLHNSTTGKFINRFYARLIYPCSDTYMHLSGPTWSVGVPVLRWYQASFRVMSTYLVQLASWRFSRENGTSKSTD